MPRRRPDKVIEHRISLSDFERTKVNRLEKVAATGVAVRGVTGIATGAGIALAGSGGLLAALVFMKFKAPDIIANVTNATNGALDVVGDVLLPGQPIELRRRAQELAKERGEIAKLETTYCTLSSEKYSAAECSQVQLRKDQYFHDLEVFRQEVNDANLFEAWFATRGQGDVAPPSEPSPWNPFTWDWLSVGERL